jgi:hypothetical protein
MKTPTAQMSPALRNSEKLRSSFEVRRNENILALHIAMDEPARVNRSKAFEH